MDTCSFLQEIRNNMLHFIDVSSSYVEYVILLFKSVLSFGALFDSVDYVWPCASYAS